MGCALHDRLSAGQFDPQRVGLEAVEADFEAVQVHGSVPVQLLTAMTLDAENANPVPNGK